VLLQIIAPATVGHDTLTVSNAKCAVWLQVSVTGLPDGPMRAPRDPRGEPDQSVLFDMDGRRSTQMRVRARRLVVLLRSGCA